MAIHDRPRTHLTIPFSFVFFLSFFFFWRGACLSLSVPISLSCFPSLVTSNWVHMGFLCILICSTGMHGLAEWVSFGDTRMASWLGFGWTFISWQLRWRIIGTLLREFRRGLDALF